MARRRKTKPTYPDNWTVSTEYRANGRILTPGTEVRIKGETGRFRFIKHVRTPDAEWIDFVGGKTGRECFRSFRPERIRTVHRINRTRANLKEPS